ncbi:hypothetical protein GCM10020331_045990 [Ectobacillus funiculus]
MFLQQERIQLAVAQEVKEYIRLNLQAVGKAAISLSPVSSENILHQQEEWLEKSGTVSSMRLDVLIAEIFNLSRQKVSPLIKKNGLVKVNWKVVEQPSYECYAGDAFFCPGIRAGEAAVGRRKIKTR